VIIEPARSTALGPGVSIHVGEAPKPGTLQREWALYIFPVYEPLRVEIARETIERCRGPRSTPGRYVRKGFEGLLGSSRGTDPTGRGSS
jgi:hypothetical protein